jgi:hypothetical protein
MLLLPAVASGGAVVAVLQLVNKARQRPFLGVDKTMGDALAAHVAAMVSNVQVGISLVHLSL